MRLYLRVSQTFAKAISQGGLFDAPDNPDLHAEKRTDKRGRLITRHVRTQEQGGMFAAPQKSASPKPTKMRMKVKPTAAPSLTPNLYDGAAPKTQGSAERKPMASGMFGDGPKPETAPNSEEARGKDFEATRDRLHAEYYDDLNKKAETLRGKKANLNVKGRQGEDVPLKGTMHAMPKGGELIVHRHDFGTGKGYHVSHVGTGARLTQHVMQSEHAAKLLVAAVKHHDFGFSKLEDAHPDLKQDVYDHQRSIRDGASRTDLTERAAKEVDARHSEKAPEGVPENEQTKVTPKPKRAPKKKPLELHEEGVKELDEAFQKDRRNPDLADRIVVTDSHKGGVRRGKIKPGHLVPHGHKVFKLHDDYRWREHGG